MASSNIDLFVDEAYLLILLNDDPFPISDEKYAEELLLQEALFSSSSYPSFAQSTFLEPFECPKTADEKQSNQEDRQIRKSQKTEHGNKENREIGESSQSKPSFCGICMDYKQNPEIFKGLINCKHEFCTDCIIKYVASKIKENIALVECPDPKCKQAIEPENCSSILPKEVFGRWENALCEAMVLGWQKFYCPYKDCSVLMVDDGEEVRESECPSCRRLFCARCQVRWHEGVTCEEFQRLGENERAKEDIMVMKLAKDQKWRRCSNCVVLNFAINVEESGAIPTNV
ncbi:hypothetical protein RDABS01_017258 [Bienertia sinuspersici]